MTSFIPVAMECPCGHRFTVTAYASIFTLFDSDLIPKLIDGSLDTFKCKKCDKLQKLSTKVLINAPRVMAWIPTDEKPKTLKDMMIKLGVLNSSHEVRDLEK